jgi:hypothetical protein
MDSVRKIQEANPIFFRKIETHIALAPDPRPKSVVENFTEKWTEKLAWDRLLHELQSIGLQEADSTLLESIQAGDTWKYPNSAKLLRLWRETYPMIFWALKYVAPTKYSLVELSLGEYDFEKTLVATPIVIKHIRDSITAERLSPEDKNNPKLEKKIISALNKRSVGELYYLAQQIPKDIENNILDHIFIAIYQKSSSLHGDENLLAPLFPFFARISKPSIRYISKITIRPALMENTTGYLCYTRIIRLFFV